MTLRFTPLFAALALAACGGSTNAPSAEAPATETAAAETTEAVPAEAEAPDGEAKATPGATEAADGEAHGHEGGEDHHGSQGEELTGFEKMRAAGNPREVDGWTVFGADFTVTEATPVATVLAAAADHEGKTIRVEGTVADVCSKMGCWMVLQAGDETIRITTKKHAFGVDRDCAGQTASLEGVLMSKEVDKELAEHYASESRKPEAMPETGKDRVWEIVATTVALKPSA